MLRGVPPMMYPTLKSCRSSPATALETQTTAATPSTAITPPVPETPSATINSAAMITVESVSPEIGLFDDPITPTRYPETVAKQKPTSNMTIAATTAATIPPDRYLYSTIIRQNTPNIPNRTIRELM